MIARMQVKERSLRELSTLALAERTREWESGVSQLQQVLRVLRGVAGVAMGVARRSGSGSVIGRGRAGCRRTSTYFEYYRVLQMLLGVLPEGEEAGVRAGVERGVPQLLLLTGVARCY